MSDSGNDTSPPQKSFKQKLVSWLPYIAIPLVAYFANVEIQSYLGEKALQGITLPQHTLEGAIELAAKQDKLVLANMSAIWCPSCRRLDQNVLSQPEVKKAIEERFVFSRIEYESDAGETFMTKYGVSGFPTILVLDSQGNKLRQLPITFSAEQFIQLLK
ncbi:MAG: thioredoxin family protein [Agarilytica sp.]